VEINLNLIFIGFSRRGASFLSAILAFIVHLANMAEMTTYLRD
jgi:hypothetical protein